ncbi:hypothetical protein TWF506_006995 [Arthrobotrys conoides]|uniref:F-box domain-containing protein n=1 Tax=Arthrobotrys conoides TaxID=74498 RepID=A0AAN8P4Q0_9PEZI
MEPAILANPSTVGEGRLPFILKFPPELHLNLLERADASQYSTLRLVCKRWYKFIENSLPLGRYVPAKIEFENASQEDLKEPPPPKLCTDSSLLLVHRGIFVFSKFRMDPKTLKMVRITVGLDFVNSPITNRIKELEAGEEAVDTALTGLNETTEPTPGSPFFPGLFCGRRDISHYLSDAVYILNPNHPEFKKYSGLVKILQDWKFTPGPAVSGHVARSCKTVREWMELFLNRYDWKEFDKTLTNSKQNKYGLYASSMKIEARLEVPSTGRWKQINVTEKKEKDASGYRLEITTTACLLGCRFRKEGEWSVARPSSPTGFTFDET